MRDTETRAETCETCGAIRDRETGRMRHHATVPVPDAVELSAMIGGECTATDGCVTDPDGRCEHGHASWLRRLGMI